MTAAAGGQRQRRQSQQQLLLLPLLMLLLMLEGADAFRQMGAMRRRGPAPPRVQARLPLPLLPTAAASTRAGRRLWVVPQTGDGGEDKGAMTESRASISRAHAMEQKQEDKAADEAWSVLPLPNTRRPARPAPEPPRPQEARERWRQFINDNINLADNSVTIPLQQVDAMFDLGVLQAGEAGTFLIQEGPVNAGADSNEERLRAQSQFAPRRERWAERELFFILDGAVRIQVRGQRVARLGTGDFLGEASFVSGKRAGPRSVTAICAGEEGAKYLVWDQASLKEFLSQEGMGPLRGALNEYWVQQLSKKLLATMGTYERNWTPEIEPADQEDDELKFGADYGFRNVSAFSLRDGAADPLAKAIPGPAWRLARWNIEREYQAIRRSVRFSGFRGGISGSGAATATTTEAGAGAGGDEAATAAMGGLLPEQNPLQEVRPFLDVPAVLRKLVLGGFGAVDQVLERLSLFPTLRQARSSTPSNPRVVALQSQLQLCTLSNAAIEEREKVRRAIQQELVQDALEQGVTVAARMKKLETPWFVLLPYFALCAFLDGVFDGRPIARFWFLETVARMPYFSYISMLHLYETLGWWTIGTDVRRVHFAEEWNELHHLQIMEALGGDTRWLDRFLARHSAILYYWILNIIFFVSPRLAYNFSELIESHAVDTYSQFCDENEALLKRLPPPRVAIEYYVRGDLFLFDEFQTSRPAYSRRPVIRTLYDVFAAIRDDESEHVKTISALQTNDDLPISPNAAAADAAWAISADEAEEKAAEKTLEEDWISEGRGYDESDRWWLEEPDYFDVD